MPDLEDDNDYDLQEDMADYAELEYFCNAAQTVAQLSAVGGTHQSVLRQAKGQSAAQ